jgi:hypothetical protein
MPDTVGKLTEAEQKKVLEWLQFHEKEPRKCPLCGSSNWTLAAHLVQPLTMGPNVTVQLGGESYPLVMLISNPCGHTLFVNAVMIGLLPPSPPSGGEQK